MEALTLAKQQGKVRFVGFTGHKDPAIHLDMLARKYPFDACQLPLNCFDPHYRSFEKQVLPELARQNIAALGMKSMGGDGQLIRDGGVLPEDALRYALSLPVASLVSGIDSLEILRKNLAIARGFQPLTDPADGRPARPPRRQGPGRPARALQDHPPLRRPTRPAPARADPLVSRAALLATSAAGAGEGGGVERVPRGGRRRPACGGGGGRRGAVGSSAA